MSGSQLENADSQNTSEEVDPFLEPLIATTLRDWLNALPEDFSSALGPVSQDEQPGDFAEMVKMLADIEQNSPAALQIYKDMGPSGLIRMFARFASDLGEFAVDAILKMHEYAPSEVGHALELFQDVLARRAVGVIGNDPAFIAAMEAVIPSQRLDQNVSQRNQG